MKFTILAAQTLLLLAGPSSILANPLVDRQGDVSQPEVESDDVLFAGEPEIAEVDGAFVDAEYARLLDGNVERPVDDEVELVTRQSSDMTNALRMHNTARAGQGVRALVWDQSLYSSALMYARHMARTGRFEHSPSASRPGQGENLGYQRSSRPITTPITTATRLWLDEEEFYNGEHIPNGNFQAYGHYTQAMWNTTLRIGIAAASDGNGAFYTVARYSPQGNIRGRKPF